MWYVLTEVVFVLNVEVGLVQGGLIHATFYVTFCQLIRIRNIINALMVRHATSVKMMQWSLDSVDAKYKIQSAWKNHTEDDQVVILSLC